MLVRCTIFLTVHNILSVESVYNEFKKMINTSYKKYSLPPTVGNETRTVMLLIDIKSLYDVSELRSSLTAQYSMGMKWQDNRLQFEPFWENDKLQNRIVMSGNVLKDEGISNTVFGVHILGFTLLRYHGSVLDSLALSRTAQLY